jgi:chromosome segregation ATPase
VGEQVAELEKALAKEQKARQKAEAATASAAERLDEQRRTVETAEATAAAATAEVAFLLGSIEEEKDRKTRRGNSRAHQTYDVRERLLKARRELREERSKVGTLRTDLAVAEKSAVSVLDTNSVLVHQVDALSRCALH